MVCTADAGSAYSIKVGEQVLQQIREEMERSYRPLEVSKPMERNKADEPPPIESAGLRSALSALYASYGLVGQLPPEPPTFRGRMGAKLIKLVQRLLFWYTPQIVHFQYSALRALEEQTRSLESAAAHLRDFKRSEGAARESIELRVLKLESELAEERAQNGRLHRAWEDLKAGISAAGSHAQGMERRFEAEIAALANAHHGMEAAAIAHSDALEAERRERASLFSQMESWRAQVLPPLEREVLRLKPQQVAQERRISLLLEEARKRWPEPFDAAQLQRLGEEDRHNLDAFYVALEDEFRGSREDIKDRLSDYPPKLAEAGIGSQAMPILDVGCGRGEWLELLRERGWQASGVDLNRVLVAMCQERGLPVIEADAIDYLRSLPEASLGAVTAFHLIEHLPLPRLIDFLDATVRALKPGGMAIFETPNPNNVFVSSRYFYLDPTHRHPIPPALGQFLAEARGLRRVEILELHPWPEAHHVDTRTGGEVAARFNECFYGPQDYAIIGRKV
jgi:2-polyprenyl-3-methyl-5-hydroxy-6-metoxy-1,4-benzoquinol methylase